MTNHEAHHFRHAAYALMWLLACEARDIRNTDRALALEGFYLRMVEVGL